MPREWSNAQAKFTARRFHSDKPNFLPIPRFLCATIAPTINQQKWQLQKVHMETQDWLSPIPPPPDPASAPPLQQGYDLRPLSAGEVLDRVFSLYRSHFWFFAGLSAASAGVNAGIGILRLVYMHFVNYSMRSPSHLLIVGGTSVVQGVVYLIAYSITLAATTFAVNAFYLGQPTTLGVALTVARQIWLRCLGVSIWQAWSAMWVFLLLILPVFLIPGMTGAGIAIGLFLFVGFIAGFIYGIIAYLRNSLALPAAVVENLKVRAAMRRSKNLATGRIGRIFLLLLLVYVLWVVATFIQLPFVFLAARAGQAQQFLMQGIMLGINFIVTTLVGPIAAIGLCLFYFDERVRREGFDIEMLLRGASIPTEPTPYPPEPAVLANPSDDPQPAPEQT
jgi:hypothetical protein